MGMYFEDTDNIYEPEIEREVADFEDEIDETEGNIGEKLKKVKADLLKVSSERKEYLDGWQRAKADYLNSKKRFEDDRVLGEKRAEIRFIEKLLPLADSFSMALDGLQKDADAHATSGDAWKSGLLQIHGQLMTLLKDLDVTTIEALGESFNPHLHEALSSQSVSDASEHDMVMAVLQKGYRHGDALIRPAKVIIGNHNS